MSDRTAIDWTDATWNPVTGCAKVSPGCQHCYAERLSHRFGWTTRPWTTPYAADNVQLHPERLDYPLHWRRPRRIFVNSLSDLFHDQIPTAFVDAVLARMLLAPQHTYQVLTKRPARLQAYLADPTTADRVTQIALHLALGDSPTATTLSPATFLRVNLGLSWPLPHLWLGVSVEDQRRANERIPLLLQTPAAVRFVSCEPLLGPLDLSPWLAALDWVIVGAESGPGARPMDDAWVRTLRNQCYAARVAFWFKQRVDAYGHKQLNPVLDDRMWHEWPHINHPGSAYDATLR